MKGRVSAKEFFRRGRQVFLYYGAAGTRIYGNEFWNLAGGVGVGIQRSGQAFISNNTFHNVGTGVQFFRQGGYTTIKNNIFSMCGASAVGQTGETIPGGPHNGSAVDYNVFWNCGPGIAGNIDQNNFDHLPIDNCPGCDPQFVDAANANFRLSSANSPAVGIGDPASPVPWDADVRIDAGRYEFGAGDPPYHYQHLREAGENTPRFTWALNDVDNRMPRGAAQTQNGFTYHTGADVQSVYQIQIDPSPFFDSVGLGRSKYDSGPVTSTNQRYTLPNSMGLPNGYYYMRVRQEDREDPAFGPWSDYTWRILIEVEGGGGGFGGGGHPPMYD